MLPLSLLHEQAAQRTDAALQDAARRRLRRADREGLRRDAAEVVGALLHEVASTSLDDEVGWASVRRRAGVHTARLAADGRLPQHLVVGPDDQPVLVNRTIAAAWRHLRR
jgi:hypothetical protein